MDVVVDLFFILVCLLSGCLFFQLLFYWGIFARFAFNKPSKTEKKIFPGVSVIICVKNEISYLEQFLPNILAQDYPDYEVVLVNDNSSDETENILREMQYYHKHLQVISISTQFKQGNDKNLALAVGIKSAKNDLILMTGADCQPCSSSWIMEMVSCSSQEKPIVLGYRAYGRQKGVLNKLIRFDTVHTAIQYFSFALTGLPYMGTKSNMLYSKRMFLDNNNYLSAYKTKSEDNDLFVSRIMNNRNTAISYSHSSQVVSSLYLQSFSEWIDSKKRHILTGKSYKFVNKLFLGLYWISGWLFYVLLIITLCFYIRVICIIGVLLGLYCIKLLSQWVVFARSCNKLNEKQLIKYIPLLDIFFMFLMPLVRGIVLFQKQKRWK